MSVTPNRHLAPLGLSMGAEAILFVVGLSAIGLAGVGVLGVDWQRVAHGRGDFLGFYTGAALVGTDGLYSQAANSEIQFRLAGFSMQGTYYVRLPFYAALLRPLAFLPYQAAYWVFQAVVISAAVALAHMYRGPWRVTAAILLFFPLAASVLVGQDITLIMAICAAAILLVLRRRDAIAGFVLSLCVIKFHLFVLVPLVLIRHRKWRMIVGAAGGAFTWLIISTLAAGPDWPRQYLSMLRSTPITLNPDRMPSIQGILSGSPLSPYVSVLVLAIFLFAITKVRNFEEGVGLALAGGLLLSTHSYIYDCVILLPALVAAIRGSAVALRGAALFLMTPIPYFLLLLGHGAIFLLCVVALAVLSALNSTRSLGDPCATS